MGYFVGIDLGSTAIKTVFVKDGAFAWFKAVPTAPGQERLAQAVMEEGLAALGASEGDIDGVATTGYGKSLIAGANRIIDEVSANALGMHLLSGGRARTIINIGGQDIKIIQVGENGKLLDFRMNDKCAAGTGRFFEMAARILDTSIQDFAALSEQAPEAAVINSTCVVFAESEIVSLVAKGTSREAIVKGLHESIARRIAGMMEKTALGGIYLDGGSANNRGLVEAIEDELMDDVNVLDHPQFTVAFGAASALAQ